MQPLQSSCRLMRPHTLPPRRRPAQRPDDKRADQRRDDKPGIDAQHAFPEERPGSWVRFPALHEEIAAEQEKTVYRQFTERQGPEDPRQYLAAAVAVDNFGRVAEENR